MNVIVIQHKGGSIYGQLDSGYRFERYDNE